LTDVPDPDTRPAEAWEAAAAAEPANIAAGDETVRHTAETRVTIHAVGPRSNCLERGNHGALLASMGFASKHVKIQELSALPLSYYINGGLRIGLASYCGVRQGLAGPTWDPHAGIDSWCGNMACHSSQAGAR
jgi:hypothetical protein